MIVSVLSRKTAIADPEECRRYLREGAAATAATIADALLPTARYPNGAWLRETKEQPSSA